MKKNIVPITVSLFLLFVVFSCEQPEKRTIRFAFYNLENLFDTIDDPHKHDNDHLPTSKIAWNTERYNHKLDNLAKVIASIDSSGFPDLMGLCEVETREVLNDLVNHPGLIPASYSILHKESPDERGIDVALLYKSEVFNPIKTQFLKVIFPWDSNNFTRDILYTKGLVAESDTLHLFINHWVSRWGGQEATEPSRRFIGRLIKEKCDSILGAQPGANILIAGDLNDNPTDSSLITDLGARPVENPVKDNALYNLGYNSFLQGEGSLYYRSWDMFDQVIVSSAMLTGRSSLKLTAPEQQVIKHDWMLYIPEKGPARPNRTAAREYYGGYSDHLPVTVSFTAR